MRFLCGKLPLGETDIGGSDIVAVTIQILQWLLILEALYLDFPVIPQAVYVLGGYRCTLQTPPAYMFSFLYPLVTWQPVNVQHVFMRKVRVEANLIK